MRNQEKNKKIFLEYSLVFFAFLLLFLPSIVGAEFSLADIKTTIEASPKNPGSYQNVLLSISSPFIELDKAEITWSLDTKIALKGIGAKNLHFKTGSVGSINKIGVVIKTLDGNIIYKDIIITPSDVDMLWESYTYTPPFYKGKALDTQESLIKIVAIPHIVDADGNKLSSENLIYKWKTKGELRSEASGFGKNVYVFRNGIVPVLETIEVGVSSIDGTSLTNKSLTLTITDTKPIIYRNDPLLGVLFNRALAGTININSVGGNEIRLSAYPFFFSIIKNKEEIDYSWKMNRKILNIDSDSVVFTKPATAGSSQIELRATGDLSVFQRGYVGFSIDFDEEI
ncbi:hypothetical protein KJ991_02060 [Patescibacteria group bacterium]|nr:hypothetical protein [Patescibacteria group bacterium]MBU4057598.1 hypothetical protein [Patescibacteria group bacterium]MBU4115584.1 hypothetical protein [Patescibacteria group bacterium]